MNMNAEDKKQTMSTKMLEYKHSYIIRTALSRSLFFIAVMKLVSSKRAHFSFLPH